MDQELVQFLEERFDRQEQRFNARFDAIDTRFDRIEQRLDSHDEQFVSINQRFVSIDQRFISIDQRFEEVNARINERFDEVKRHTGVLVEGLRHEVQLVAEGFAVFVEGRYAQDQANIARQFRDTQALIRSSYDHLQQRVENLERKPPN